ncbi:hypothetical protein [Leptospira noguchii]|uniref:Uncharacterized protein n=1 Tax=Leptospira noguchii TaxID=28182 RepID=A0AAE9GFF9_9LEPT|nr:hypothetical protein [Leptospira noguchii]UOG57108.1 hypothetical protein MAL03_02580 [Leptospira noguchii]
METKAQRFPKGRVVGWDLVLQRISRNSHRFNIEIQILVGLIMPLYGSVFRFWDKFLIFI